MAAFSDFRAPLARTLAALTAVLVLASCGGSGEEAPQGSSSSSSHTGSQDGRSSHPTESSPTDEDSDDDAASCADTTGVEAVAEVLTDLPRLAPEMAWDPTTATTDTYDPCAALSWVGVVIERPTGSSPKHLLLFHRGEYVGTATKGTVSQLSDVTRVSDGEITARLGMESGAGAPIPAPTTIRWDDATNAVVTTGASSPSPAGGTTETAAASCAGGTTPSGVDPRVCSRQPSGATPFPINASTGFAEFVSPSSNIMCELASDYVECVMIAPATRVTLEATGPARRSAGTHPVTTFDRSTLRYGDIGTRDQFACLSEEVGVSCWSTKSGHGMFLARERVTLW